MISEHKQQRVIELRRQGFVPSTIADKTNLSTQAVRKILRANPDPQRPMRHCDRPEVIAAKELLKDGYPRETIVAVFGEGVL